MSCHRAMRTNPSRSRRQEESSRRCQVCTEDTCLGPNLESDCTKSSRISIDLESNYIDGQNQDERKGTSEESGDDYEDEEDVKLKKRNTKPPPKKPSPQKAPATKAAAKGKAKEENVKTARQTLQVR
ncbi:hypothetical protein EV702DRAFT_1198684 [Suillus placidus]|uniref:Uncharacterized protein n=1 Tax=Suillus placidus TaxID=48579 RepID=A0A9P7D2I4_9AGAM|nr:hypothetical protein EV702DRAFT_1198684 [Suillus placidus]